MLPFRVHTCQTSFAALIVLEDIPIFIICLADITTAHSLMAISFIPTLCVFYPKTLIFLIFYPNWCELLILQILMKYSSQHKMSNRQNKFLKLSRNAPLKQKSVDSNVHTIIYNISFCGRDHFHSWLGCQLWRIRVHVLYLELNTRVPQAVES